MAEEKYTWTDNPTESGKAVCDTDILNDCLMHLKYNSGGSGLEVCDIGMALYVDETKGLRRYLNGQIVDINANTQAFLNRLKQITTLHPSLLCTENEWQTAKTMSVFGQVGKFVFNYSGETVVSVRIPRVVNIQGVFDLQNLGLTVGAGLPTHTHTRGTMEISAGFTGGTNYMGGNIAWGAISKTGETDSVDPGDGRRHQNCNYNFYASRSWKGSTSAPDNSIYGASNTVQQEAIQYPYFIQIATGSETENNIVNEIELNNPYSLFDSKYSPIELNNISWLASNGQWNAKATYPDYYNWILENVNNGVEDFKLSTDTYDDYSWVINTADETFRLPLLDGSEDLLSDKYEDLELLASGSTYIAPANGWYQCAFTGTAGSTFFELVTVGVSTTASFVGGWGRASIPVKKGDVVTVYYGGANFTKQVFRFSYAQGNGTLYYYVGETVQNANLIDAGRIGEILPAKTDKVQAAQASMPSGKYIDLTLGASGSSYTAPANGYVSVRSISANSTGPIGLVNSTTEFQTIISANAGWGFSQFLPVRKGDIFKVIWQGNRSSGSLRFYYAEGEV